MRTALVLVGLLGCTVWTICGCSSDSGGGGVSSNAPEVTETYPTDAATGVSLNTPISITFSEDMDEATLDSIYIDGGATFYAMEYDGDLKKVTAELSELLEPETEYRVMVSSYCADMDGEPLDSDYTFDFTTGDFGCDGLEDPFSTSKTIATASRVDLDHRYRLVPSCGGDENMHVFKFTLDEATKITTHYTIVDADTSKLSWRFRYMREDGLDYYAAGSGVTLDSYYDYQAAYSFLPGTYYIKTGKTYGTGHTAVYELLLETSSACVDDAYEDNDFFDQATPVTEGSYNLRGCSVDKDYLSIELEAGQQLDVTLSYELPEADYIISVYNSSQVEMARYMRYANPFSFSYTAGASGTYYVVMFFWTDDHDYSLDFDITGP